MENLRTCIFPYELFDDVQIDIFLFLRIGLLLTNLWFRLTFLLLFGRLVILLDVGPQNMGRLLILFLVLDVFVRVRHSGLNSMIANYVHLLDKLLQLHVVVFIIISVFVILSLLQTSTNSGCYLRRTRA